MTQIKKEKGSRDYIRQLKGLYSYFGFRVGNACLLSKLIGFSSDAKSIKYKLNNYKHRCILDYLKHNYSNIIRNYSYIQENEEYEKISEYKDYIWTIWWQGEENAPEHIQFCYKTMREYASGHNVVVISKDNLNQFLHLPDYIIQKVDEGKISFIHLADIIRMNLICLYGGIWLDATIFLTSKISEDLFGYDYYTGKLERTPMVCVSEARWNGTFFGGKPGNPFCRYMVEFYNEYWKRENQAIDYFLIDYMTELAYENIPWFKAKLDQVPLNNSLLFEGEKMLNMTYTKELYDTFTSNNQFHKLVRRKDYYEMDEFGKKTMYGHLVDRIKAKG